MACVCSCKTISAWGTKLLASSNADILIYFLKLSMNISHENYKIRRKEGNILFNDGHNTFYLWLCGKV